MMLLKNVNVIWRIYFYTLGALRVSLSRYGSHPVISWPGLRHVCPAVCLCLQTAPVCNWFYQWVWWLEIVEKLFVLSVMSLLWFVSESRWVLPCTCTKCHPITSARMWFIAPETECLKVKMKFYASFAAHEVSCRSVYHMASHPGPRWKYYWFMMESWERKRGDWSDLSPPISITSRHETIVPQSHPWLVFFKGEC